MAAANKRKRAIRHVAIIMDGNGRWARRRGLPHLEGHKQGAAAVRRTIAAANDAGLDFLTLYAFSTENWKRPKTEVNGLMSLLRTFIDENIDEIMEKRIRIRTIGNLRKIPASTRKKLSWAIQRTEQNDKGTVIIALNYGGREEITHAARELAEQVKKGTLKPSQINEKRFTECLYAPDVPDPELLIRTSGEMRISNFLLWQLSYAELYVTDTLWPDFGENEFQKAIDAYHQRNRRFGGR